MYFWFCCCSITWNLFKIKMNLLFPLVGHFSNTSFDEWSTSKYYSNQNLVTVSFCQFTETHIKQKLAACLTIQTVHTTMHEETEHHKSVELWQNTIQSFVHKYVINVMTRVSWACHNKSRHVVCISGHQSGNWRQNDDNWRQARHRTRDTMTSRHILSSAVCGNIIMSRHYCYGETGASGTVGI